ncbi:helix-turn-helix domain-containing protein [Microbispora sp. CA-102843]|uniref:helix-turn-helix domain-containing protein n=1 Tax=Microbispora sp. CA-102843 TaxID=3239952 RepID=UPI003D8B8FAD
MTYSPTVRRRTLSAKLRHYREQSRLDATKVARQLGWDPSKVSRMERGAWKRPNPRDVVDLLDLYGVTEPAERAAMVQLANESRHRGWWAEYSDVFRTALPDFEAGASLIHTYEMILIPGLLQTPDYAAAIFRGGCVLEEAAVKRRVDARMARQEILQRANPPTFRAVIDEAALRKNVGGPAVMRAQLLRLAELAAQPHITIQVLPDAAGAHAAMLGAFMLMWFPGEDEAPLVFLETATAAVYLEKPEEVQCYSHLYEQVVASAASVEDSVTYLEEMAHQLNE